MNYPSRKIIVGSRESPLAKEQVEIFLKILKSKLGVSYLNFIEKKFIKTSGDKFLNQSISEIGNKGLFTKEIDEAQIKSIDIAVHSLKIFTELPKGLYIGAVLKREKPNDVFSFKKYDIKNNKRRILVGTSVRRKIQLENINSNLEIKDIRGNVGTRIKKVRDGYIDSIVLHMLV